MTILLTGATGKVGGAVLDELGHHGPRLRLLVRSSARLARVPEGVSVVEGDMARPGQVARALEGVTRALLVSPPGELQGERESVFIERAVAAGLECVVRISSLGANPASSIPLLRCHGELDESLKQSGLAHTLVRPHFFMQNMELFARSIAERGEFSTSAGSGRVSMIHAGDVGRVAASALLSTASDSGRVNLTGPEALTFDDVAERLGRRLGRSVRHRAVDADSAREALLEAGTGRWFADSFVALYALYARNEGGLPNGEVERVTMAKPQSFDEYARSWAELGGVDPRSKR